MKKLLFIGIVALMVQSLGAVTLPSTSYSSYSASTPSSERFTTTGGTMVTGSYSTLGSYDVDACTTGTQGVPPSPYTECSVCCYNLVYLPCANEFGKTDPQCLQAQDTCTGNCQQGGSLPLDGGLSILLVLSLAGGAAKVLRNRNKE